MNDQTKSLIAIGASVAVNCRPCTEYHLSEARSADASDEQVAAAVQIGLQVNRGAHGKTREWVGELLGKEPVATADVGCSA